jgi:hypothetical protein
MGNTVVAVAVGLMIALILFTVTQSIFLGSDTTGWSTLQITLAGLTGTVVLIVAIVGAFKYFSR